MNKVERSEVLGLAEYERVREPFRVRVIDEKKRRRTKLGDKASAIFENKDTVLLQIQEMLRTERITREAAVQHEIDTYNELVPGPHELSATVFVEIPEKEERERFLVDARGLEKAFAIDVDGERCPGKNDASREFAERTTAVHYLKFPLTERAERALRDVLEKKRKASEVVVELVADHPAYQARSRLSPETIVSLAEDLA